MVQKRFIDVGFPIKEVSRESVREKNIRHGHISTLHIWWARRPLAASRATSYAALIPAPKDDSEYERKKRFIIELSKWENSLNSVIIDKARKDILEANGGKTLKVLDPFAGGGSIPLECLRLGLETYAGEYNPVAVLILKCTLEYPQKYGNLEKAKEGWLKTRKNPLLEDVKKWGEWVLNEAKKELERFYPKDEDGSIPVGYIWARAIPCQNPNCGAQIPLMRQFWLAKKSNRKIALKPYIKDGRIEFEIVGQEKPFPEDFDPSKGTVKGAKARCLVCGTMIDDKTVRRLFQQGKAGQRMIAVVLYNPKTKGKFYRIATEKDLEAYREAEEYLEEKRAKLMEEWGIDPIPDEPTPEGKGKGAERAFSVRNFGLNTYGDLFNSRQKLALITFTEKVRIAYQKMIEEGYDKEYAKAVVSYLGLIVSRMADFESTICKWHPQWEFIPNTFARQALPMMWDYGELNLFSPVLSGTFESMHRQILRVIDNVSRINNFPAAVSQFSATSLPYPDNYFDAVFTDPPYYDNVPYSYLSDFFYVWLKRSIGDLYPDLFATPLTPKSEEIVAYTINRTWEEAKRYFEEGLKKAFKEIYRVLKPNGVATIVYTHKSTSGWEALINSLLESGLVITASWPIHTEMQARLRARESAALASSIYFVAHKAPKEDVGWYNEVKEEIRKRLYEKLERLWKEGISGADYFIAAIGSAIEVFGRYKEVKDLEGNVVKADKLLEFVRSIVTDYVVRQVLHNGIAGELSPLTKFYILWRWTYGEQVVHFDDARKLAQGVGVDLASEWNRGFIRKEKEFIRVLGPQDRRLDEIKTNELIDVLHRVLILWREGKSEELKNVLVETGWGMRDVFYRVAQAISETLPPESKEKKLLDGFLSGKEKIISEIGSEQHIYKQRKLLDYMR
ncbi:MAG: DUF1156 domain-containing protein [Sulfolobales archaeon]